MKRSTSKLLIANAWHSRTDALSSLVVLIGAVLSMAIYEKLDGVAAVIVSLMIGKIGWDFVKESLSELTDAQMIQSLKESIWMRF